jgi:hypothetical protein|nr:MAG TPA: Large polyvalent protein associated domain 29 [Caudoviricetes sp.]
MIIVNELLQHKNTKHIQKEVFIMATITMNNEKNGIEIRFDGKPESSIIVALKENGFRWSGKQKMWYAKQSADRISFAESLEEFSSPIKNKVEQHEKYNLWEMTRTDGIEDNYSKYHIYSTKEIAAIIRKNLRARFPMCKWSITSDYNSICIDLLASPFCSESDEIKAIIHYAYKFAESYNYDNSDSMTDYFDVNFYGVYESSILSHHYEQKEMTDDDKEMCKVFQQNKVDFEAAEEIRKQKEFEEQMKQREIEEAEAKKRAEIRKANEKIIEDNHTVKKVNYTIVNAILKANKDDNLDHTEIYDEKQCRETCQVSREVHFTTEVYALFEKQLMSDYSFFDGMGGSRTDDRRIQSSIDYDMMTEEERETVEWYNIDCVAIYCDGELKLIVDPQGYNYARYVYVYDEQSQKVDTYHSDYGISEEEHQHNIELAETIEDVSTEIISQNEIKKTWQDEDFDLYKACMKEWIYANKFKLNAGIVRAITIPELKTVMYKVLTEVDSIAEQFKNTNLEAGQRITIVKYSDFGMMSVSKVTFHSYEIGQYAQYDNSVKMTFKPHRKKGLYYKWFYGDVIIYNGWYDLPDTVLFDISYKEHCITQKSKWVSFDRKQYDAILEYFAEQGLKPIINTYKPQFRK